MENENPVPATHGLRCSEMMAILIDLIERRTLNIKLIATWSPGDGDPLWFSYADGKEMKVGKIDPIAAAVLL